MHFGESITRVLSAALCLSVAGAEQAAELAQTSLAPATARSLKIYILEGSGAVNSIGSGSATAPVIEVRDERNLPAPGVEVLFQLPPSGPGGFFAGRRLTWTALTDANGQAAAPSLIPNQRAGHFGIHVTANAGGSSARAMIAQTNSRGRTPAVARHGGGHGLWWKVLAGAAVCGAVAGGVVWATRGEEGKAAVVLQAGSVTFGGPR